MAARGNDLSDSIRWGSKYENFEAHDEMKLL